MNFPNLYLACTIIIMYQKITSLCRTNNHITLCPCISHTYLDLIRVLHVSDIYGTVKQNISTVDAVLTTALLNDASLILCKVCWVFCIQLILLSFQNTHTPVVIAL